MTSIFNHWFIFQNNALIVHKDALEKSSLPLSSTDAQIFSNSFSQHFLLETNHDAVIHCAELPHHTILPNHFMTLPLRQALQIENWYGPLCKSHALITWDKHSRYCGQCGHETIYLDNKVFERKCSACNLHFYPRISPSIIVLIHRKDEILLARGTHFAPNIYGLIAGFVEVGENIEAAVHREVKEEINLSIRNLRYVGSQFWPFPDSLMIGFFAEYAEGELKINPEELVEANWYSIHHLPGYPSTRVSIAHKMIDAYLNEFLKQD